MLFDVATEAASLEFFKLKIYIFNPSSFLKIMLFYSFTRRDFKTFCY